MERKSKLLTRSKLWSWENVLCLVQCAIINKTFYNPFLNFKPHLIVPSPTAGVTVVYKNGSLSLQGVPESCMLLHQRPPTETGSGILLMGMVVRFAENRLNLSRLCTLRAPLYWYQVLCRLAVGQMASRTYGVCIHIKEYVWSKQGLVWAGCVACAARCKDLFPPS